MERAEIVKEAEVDILIKGCIDWDRNSQTMLYKHFSSRMFAVCLRYSKNREEAEDTLQEGFVKVFENLVNFKREGSLEGWIRKIMVNTSIQKFRKNAQRPSDVSLDESIIEPSEPETIVSSMHAEELLVLIQKLPPKYRMVFNLYVMEGFNHKEIAAQLGISEGTSKSNLHDARRVLQKEIQKLTADDLAHKH